MIRKLPAALTSYDLLKSFAVLTMLIDHAGYYFFPDDLWWRAVGRLSFPAWLFLIGYARGREIPFTLMLGALVLLFSSPVMGTAFFPLNILFTIMLVRTTLDPLMRFCMRSPFYLWSVALALFAFTIPSFFVCEYGTQAFIIAMFGYMVRHRKQAGEKTLVAFGVFTLVSFVVMQQFYYGFTLPQFLFIAASGAALRYALYRFQPETFPALTEKIPRPVSFLLQFMGRHTLEIYIVHILLFRALAMHFTPERFPFMQGGLI